MRVNYPEIIAENASELKLLLNKPKNLTHFQKIQALYLLKTSQVKTITNLAELLGVHRVTIQKWLKKYRDEGLKGLLVIKEKTGRPPQLNPKAIALIEQRLTEAENGFKSYEEIQKWLSENCQLEINYKTLYHWIRYKFKAKLKVPRRSAIKKNEQEVEKFKKNCHNY